MIQKSNVLQWRKVKILSATFFCITFALLSCKKKETPIGKEAFNPDNLLGSSGVDTFQLKTYVFQTPTEITSKNVSFALLGTYADPKFGTVNAGFYTQLLPTAFLGNAGFGTGVTVDSIVLGLQYGGFYGKAGQHTFEVYELNEALSNEADVIYYPSTTKLVKPTNLVAPGYGDITFKPTTKTVVGNDTLSPLLRIRLNNSLAQHFIDEGNNNASTSFKNNTDFLNFFQGIQVKVSSPATLDGGIGYFNLNAANSKITIYYKEAGVSKFFDLVIKSECADFNHVDFNRIGSAYNNVILNPGSGQTEFYAQSFTGRGAIEFPGVNNIPKNSVIHQAKLYLPVTHYTNSSLYPSAQLGVGTRKSFDNDSIFGTGVTGVYDDNLKAYTLDVRAYIQLLVNKQITNTGLVLAPSFFNSTVERIIFNGPQSVNKKKPKLVVTYTTY